ncbi:MAG: VOC family protein [Candidatus Dojkabacteria bacterium]
MSKITPCLWYNNNIEEAVNFYKAIFKNSKLLSEARYPAGSPSEFEGKLMTATLEIEGQELIMLNGGPGFEFTEAISFFVKCKDQTEVDYYWERLTADGGEESQCGWLKDRFGLSWQIVPDLLGELMNDSDKEKASRVMQAMLKMKKIDSELLQKAYDNK